MTLNWKLGNERGHNIPMELPFGLRQLGLKQEANYVSYQDHLLFDIRELMSFILQRHFVVKLSKTTQVALALRPLHF